MITSGNNSSNRAPQILALFRKNITILLGLEVLYIWIRYKPISHWPKSIDKSCSQYSPHSAHISADEAYTLQRGSLRLETCPHDEFIN